MNWLPWHPWEIGESLIFHRKAFKHPVLPLTLGKAELTDLFTLDAQSLAGKGAGEFTCPQGISRSLWHHDRAAWWSLPWCPPLHFLLCSVPSGGYNGVVQSSVVSEQCFSPALKALYNEGYCLCPEMQSPLQLSSRPLENAGKHLFRKLSFSPGLSYCCWGWRCLTTSSNDPSGQPNMVLRDCVVLPP